MTAKLAVLATEKLPETNIPNFLEFTPKPIRWQDQALYDITHADYSDGVHEFLFSGSVGSAKSLLLAHIIIRHCLEFRRARVGIGRESLADLKDTLYQMILDHMEGAFEQGKHYRINGKGHIIFRNGSKILPYSWGDKRYKKFRSHSFSLFVIEELTENKERTVYDEIKMRVGRLTHIPFAAIICATNPDDPAHWVYDYFIKGKETNPKIHVYYSLTHQNPFLKEWYVRGLQETLDPKMADRMLRGQWVSILTDKIYYAYDDTLNVIPDYKVDPAIPVGLTFDFNIGPGKPMSAALFQYVNERFVFFDEVIIEGSRTLDVMEEIAARGHLDKGWRWEIFGDASGKSNDTRSIKTDYTIIKQFLANYETPTRTVIEFEMKVPLSNPPIRARHNRVNAALLNDLGVRSLLVTRNCATIRKGLQLTALKKGAEYIEDDTKPYQHVTTAVGYAVVRTLKAGSEIKVKVIQN